MLRGYSWALILFLSTVDDIHTMVMNFNSHSTEIRSHSNENVSFEGNMVADAF